MTGSTGTSLLLHTSGKSRKRKKRRKRRLPHILPRHGCRRPCVHQRQVPAVRIPVATQRQVPTVHSFTLPVQFLDKVLDWCRKLWLRSCRPSKVVGIPFVPQKLIPMVLAPIETHQLLFDMVVNAQNVQVVQVFILVVAPRLTPMVLTVEQTTVFPSCCTFFGRCPCSSTECGYSCLHRDRYVQCCLCSDRGDSTAVVVQRHCAHRQSGGHCRYATVTGTHSARLCTFFGLD